MVSYRLPSPARRGRSARSTVTNTISEKDASGSPGEPPGDWRLLVELAPEEPEFTQGVIPAPGDVRSVGQNRSDQRTRPPSLAMEGGEDYQRQQYRQQD
jgi:hypothetical protein